MRMQSSLWSPFSVGMKLLFTPWTVLIVGNNLFTPGISKTMKTSSIRHLFGLGGGWVGLHQSYHCSDFQKCPIIVDHPYGIVLKGCVLFTVIYLNYSCPNNNMDIQQQQQQHSLASPVLLIIRASPAWVRPTDVLRRTTLLKWPQSATRTRSKSSSNASLCSHFLPVLFLLCLLHLVVYLGWLCWGGNCSYSDHPRSVFSRTHQARDQWAMLTFVVQSIWLPAWQHCCVHTIVRFSSLIPVLYKDCSQVLVLWETCV